MKSVIRAAIESGRPPLELLLDQPNRERTRLDGTLIKAYYLEQAYEVEGHAAWVEDSPDISFVLRTRDLRSLAVVEKAQDDESKKKNPTRGRRFWAEPVLRQGAKWPTRAEWLKKNASREYVEDTTQAERIAEAEERAAAKVAENPEAAAIVAEMQKRFKAQADKMDKEPVRAP